MTKKIILILLLPVAFSLQSAYGQRYLSGIFTRADSVTDIPYGHALNYKGENETLYFDLYTPQGDQSDKRPLLIYAHGGGFTGGTRKWPSIRMMCEKLAQRGYAVASISYRVDPRFNYMHSDTNRKVVTDAMHDMRAAIRFFKANQAKYRIDTSNIFISGESAGAITAMMAGYVDRQNELKAYPKTDPDNTEGNSGTTGYSSSVKAVLCLCGLIYDTLAIDSPQESPLLWVHGSSDPLIPIAWAEQIVLRAKHVGLSYQKIIFDGATHCPWYYGLPRWQFYLDSTVNYMARFMYGYITGKTAPPLAMAPPPLKLANVLQSNMVIQQHQPFRLWGTAAAGDTITIRADWVKRPLQVYTAQNGQWSGSITVPRAKPGNFDPHTILVIHRQDTLKLDNILIGDVWLCAGQSNMDMTVAKIDGWYPGVLNYQEEIAAADYPAIRMYKTRADFKLKPQDDCEGKWQVCSPRTAGGFSATAYFFGRMLFRQLNIPIGLVVSAVAGASCQAFIPEQVLTADPLLKKKYFDPYLFQLVSQAKVDSLDFFTRVTRPMLIYNAMIHPLEKLSIRGFIWYQGESNYTEKGDYTYLCGAMLKSWRNNFHQDDLPFYFVQIAPYGKNMDKRPDIAAFFREAQEGLLKIKNTGMAVTMDVGEVNNIHPKDKRSVGERLARAALYQTYRLKDMAYEGPRFSSFSIKNDTAVISFTPSSVGTGLATRDGQAPEYFYLAGNDKVFHPAAAWISGNTIHAYTKAVQHPVAIRYAFINDAITNFENKGGLPAIPFRTDHWDE